MKAKTDKGRIRQLELKCTRLEKRLDVYADALERLNKWFNARERRHNEEDEHYRNLHGGV